MGAFLRASALLIVLVFAGSTSGCMPVWEQVQARIAPGDQPAAPLRLDPPSAPPPTASVAKPDIKPVEIAAVPDLDDFEMASGPASDRHPAVTQIEAFGEEVLIVLENESLDGDQRINRFRQLLARDLDIDLIGRFVLGRHWKSADEAQRADYLAVFSSFLVRTYSTRLGGVRI
ncbi:MAG: ABC transporter substrate-binding protein, partial [Rhodospirillales bacterium]|nr:ABC transporter substrate-binding protein [Rhodospirillales bacterium]